MRFRLDPREAEAPVERPAARPAAAPPPAAAPAPVASASLAPRWTRTRLVVVAVVALVLLAGGSGAVLYATNSGPFAYPHAYLVEGSHVPRGLSLPAVPQDVQDRWGITSNPGQVPSDQLDSLQNGASRPDDAWVEVLQAGTRADALTILAAKYSDTDAANGAVATARSQCSAGGAALLQDGDVVVLVVAGDQQALPYYSTVVSTILGQVHGLQRVCG